MMTKLRNVEVCERKPMGVNVMFFKAILERETSMPNQLLLFIILSLFDTGVLKF